MDEFPKALTNEAGDQIVVADAEQEAAEAKNGWVFGGPKPAKKAKAEPEAD